MPDYAFLFGIVVLGLLLATLIGIVVFGRPDENEQRRLRRGAIAAAVAYVGLFTAWFLVSAL